MSDLTFSKLHTQGEKKSRQTWNKQGKERLLGMPLAA
jgi:hypothetical protein